MTVDFVRTPDDRFADLPDFPYEPRYVEVDGLRMAYVEEGSGAAGTFLLLHGEPTWGYLYRRMIPPLVDAGYRVIAPDLIGFGRSDKPTDRAATPTPITSGGSPSSSAASIGRPAVSTSSCRTGAGCSGCG